MSDSFLAVPLHFTIEFLGFLVAAGGALLVGSRPALVPGASSNRVPVGLGLGILAIAQALHGASFVEADGDEFLVALRALGLAFVLIGIVGGLRPAAAAPAAFTIKEPLLLAPAGAAFLVAIMAFVSSVRNGPRELRRLGVAAIFLGISELLTAVVPDEKFGAGNTDAYAYAAHGAKALGFIVLAAWLWSGVRSSIATRFIAVFAGLLVAVILALSSALTGVISNNVDREELERAGVQVRNQVQNEVGDEPKQELTDAAELIGGLAGPALERRADMHGDAQALVERRLADFILFLDASGDLLGQAGTGPVQRLRTQAPPLDGSDVVRIIGTDPIETVRSPTHDVAAAPTKVHGSLALIAAREIEIDRKTVGFVALGRWIDAGTMEEISDRVKPAKASLVLSDSMVSELPGRPAPSEILPADVRARILVGEVVTEKQSIDDRSYFSAFAPIEADGIPIGATLVLSSPTRNVLGTRQDITRTLFLVAMAIGAVALALAWLSGRRITRPIQVLTKAARAVREGDLRVQAPVTGEDEVGQLGDTFNEMTASLFRMTNDLREAAREEHQLRARIETIIQSMADGLVAVDAERKILAFNRQAEALTGVKAATAIGTPVEKVLEVRDAKGERVALPIHHLAEGSDTGIFLVRRLKNSVPVTVVSAVLRGEEGEIAGAVAVLRDMTREHEVERMKSEFLSNISHELRTPLTPIKGYAEILGRKPVAPEKAKQFVKGILESTARLERIVELLVDFAAMEGGRLAPRTTPVDVGSIIEKLATDWGQRTPQHDLVVDVKGRLPKVMGDERLLTRSLEEILDNAVKFSPHGGKIMLTARGANSTNGGGKRRAVEVTISDEGIGIDPEQVPKIFSDFQQLDGSETRTYGGLGLGLAFVQRIVHAHQGSVEVESRLDEGTRLTIRIPAAAASSTD